MPFGPYDDFADCVRQNGDKRTPEAFCAFLHHEITGRWPSQMEDQAQTQWMQTAHGLRLRYQAPDTVTITGLEVFAAGTWTDMSGATRTTTRDDLERIASASDPARIALKVGHTSPGFHERVAVSLGVPLSLVEGEGPDHRGALALGHATRLYVKGDTLLADFAGVPAAIADLIEGQQFSGVSSEFDVDEEDRLAALTAVALLGAERPAVDSLRQPVEAGIHGAPVGPAWVGLTTPSRAALGRPLVNLNDPARTAALQSDRSLVDRLLAAFGLGAAPAPHQEDDMPEIARALGLPEDATLEQIVAAIMQMQEAMGGMAKPDADQAQASAPPPDGDGQLRQQLADALKRVGELETASAAAQHAARLARWGARAATWTTIVGKPDEMAAKLVDIEEKAGADVAESMAAAYQAQHDAAAALLHPVGRSHFQALPGGAAAEDPFEAQLKREAAEAKVADWRQMLAVYAQSPDPQRKAQFWAYENRKAAANGSKAAN